MHWRKIIPWSMVGFRALLGPALFVSALRLEAPELWLGAMIAAGFFSDVYDGILARRWRTETAALRLADSVADTVFYLGVLAAIVERHWPVLRDRLWLLAPLLALEALRLAFDWAKFGRMASYHSYAAKIWGLLLAAATMALLCFDRAFWLATLALGWGILCDLEGLAMSALLPQWTHDVKTLRRALELRRQMAVALAGANDQ
ncbi:MAG: CDP-alcohol phosphatidyltransferase family protein [Acidobacteriota bacterium]|nr:CDP-alcohol phosphatidyltransferase family protein [Acidobacteriota bacterium]